METSCEFHAVSASFLGKMNVVCIEWMALPSSDSTHSYFPLNLHFYTSISSSSPALSPILLLLILLFRLIQRNPLQDTCAFLT
jgi:hypothetical protein